MLNELHERDCTRCSQALCAFAIFCVDEISIASAPRKKGRAPTPLKSSFDSGCILLGLHCAYSADATAQQYIYIAVCGGLTFKAFRGHAIIVY